MKYYLTAAGLAASQAVQSGGPRVTLTEMRLGNGFGYTPSSSDTGLHGATVYTLPITSFKLLDPNTTEALGVLLPDVGGFSFGEVGIYMEGNVLFALGAMTVLQNKVARPNDDWNEVQIRAALEVTEAAAVFNWIFNSNVYGSIPELSYWYQLDAPTIAQVNAYIIHERDGFGNTALAVRDDTNLWSVSTHHKNLLSGTVQSVIGYVINLAIDQNHLIGAMPIGAFIIQYTTGLNKGRIALIVDADTNTLTLGSGSIMPVAGDQFKILAATGHTTPVIHSPFVLPNTVKPGHNGREIGVTSGGTLTFESISNMPNEMEVTVFNLHVGSITLDGGNFHDGTSGVVTSLTLLSGASAMFRLVKGLNRWLVHRYGGAGSPSPSPIPSPVGSPAPVGVPVGKSPVGSPAPVGVPVG